MSGKERNFDRLPVDLVDTLGVQYDYESIMHYSRTAFSVNGQPTVLPKRDPFANLGQRHGFSHSDVLKINKLYRCGQCLRPSRTSYICMGGGRRRGSGGGNGGGGRGGGGGRRW